MSNNVRIRSRRVRRDAEDTDYVTFGAIPRNGFSPPPPLSSPYAFLRSWR